MATTTSPQFFSVLTSSQENNDDFVNQLRNHLTQIEANVQQTLQHIQRRQPYTSIIASNSNPIDEKMKNNFLHVLKDLATKNNLPFDEPLFRQQVLASPESSSSPNVDVVRNKPVPIDDTNDQHLSPVNQTRRSQFAPVLSSTPVHQTSPIMPIPVDLTMATPSAAPVLTVNSADLPAVPPSAIVPQRANLTRPPRVPRGESASRQKKNPSPIKEQQIESEVIVAEEVRVTSKRRIRTKHETIENSVQILIERSEEIIKTVQATPLRGRKKKIIPDDPQPIPQLEPPPVSIEPEVRAKTTRAARSKKKESEGETRPEIRASSVRQRKKQEEVQIPKELPPISSPPKKVTRSRKKTDQQTEAIAPAIKVRATPQRGKKKSTPEVTEPVITLSPKRTTTRSKKRKGNDDPQPNSTDTIQPPSPKRRGGRHKKSLDPSSPPPVAVIISPLKELALPVLSTRSSRRGKKDVEVVEEKQDPIVLKKKTRGGRGKKTNDSIHTDAPVTVIDIVTTSVATVSAPIPTSISMDSIVKKPPRPPVARQKKSIAMPPISQTSPSTPPSSKQRIQSTSPVNDKPLLPLPVVTGRRRQAQRRGATAATSPSKTDAILDVLPSTNRKRTRSSVASTPKRARQENLLLTNVLGTPGKKRNKCTCEKRRHRICDICAAAIDM